MRVIDPGHRYALDNLETGDETTIQFYKDATLHGGDGYPGPSCQEYLRAIIDRVQELDRERPWEGNATIVHDLRHAIAGFEARALIRRVEADGLAIERVPVAGDGHILLAQQMCRELSRLRMLTERFIEACPAKTHKATQARNILYSAIDDADAVLTRARAEQVSA